MNRGGEILELKFGKTRIAKTMFLVIIDILMINIAYLYSFYVRFNLVVPQHYRELYYKELPVVILCYLIPGIFFKMYSSLWENAGVDEFIRATISCSIGFALNITIMNLLSERIPNVVTILSGVLIFLLVLGTRVSYRVFRRISTFGRLEAATAQRVLVIGAGDCGRIVIDEMKKDKRSKLIPVAIIDDDVNKRNTYLRGIKILGDRGQIIAIVEKKNIDLILIAIPSLDGKNKKELIEICQSMDVKVKIIPGVYEILGDKVNLTKMRNVDLKDLLGREEVKLDKSEIEMYLKNKVVLVSGGGGSIGSELCRQIALFKPKKLLILDIYENNAYDLENDLKRNMKDLDQDVLIASVRDKQKLDEIFEIYKPNVVFHAAAHKHVPLMEFNPSEAIKNNVKGTYNMAKTASEHGVDRFVLISTDKAVNPTNVMGATKRMCEMIIQSMDKSSKTEFVAVRFGNVLGSNGSVIPLFKRQIDEGGPVTLTHKDITRYFMLIPEAAQLVLQAGTYAKGGEIFVLDMGSPVKIYDLAEKLIKLSGFEPHKDIDIITIGLRPGEKLYEELLMSEEGLMGTGHDKIFIGRPGSFDIEVIERMIDELMEVAQHGTKEELRIKLAEVVPTYVRDN